MFQFELNDSTNIFSGASFLQFNLARALKLLAYATAPSPGSRYQPGASWSVVKYGTAIEPRLLPSATQIAIANAGIWDLDPHQKTVLADDMGVGIALAALDVVFGIDGLWDCYSLWLQGHLQLSLDGRHGRMPDFLVSLHRSIKGSQFALLECKGSTRNNAAAEQLTSACVQLNNVNRVLRLPKKNHGIPRVGIATVVHPGAPVVIHVSDPPEEFPLPAQILTMLQANYVALELAALGDTAASDSVRSRYRLPSWGTLGIPNRDLPTSAILALDQMAVATLPANERISKKARETLDLDLMHKFCLSRSHLVLEPSKRAIAMRAEVNDESKLHLDIAKHSDVKAGITAEYTIDASPGIRRRVENDAAPDGSRATLTIDIWSASS